MKSTGIVRKVDELGRIVLPAELRRTLGIAERDPLEIFVDGGSVILQKFEERCVFCGDTEQVRAFKGKSICPQCLAQLKKTRKLSKTEENSFSSVFVLIPLSKRPHRGRFYSVPFALTPCGRPLSF